MDESEGKDTYVSQLKEVFDSCDTTGSGSLNEAELLSLCEHLHLSDSASFLVHHLLRNESEVKFDDFKECFVAILTESIPSESEVEEADAKDKDDNAEREVSPKFTLGRKKYGRRSRPASIADEDGSATPSPVLSPQNSSEDSSVSFGKAAGIMNIQPENTTNKRPVSPESSQTNLPPSKTGRMVASQLSRSGDANSIVPATDSDSDLNQSFECNPVQYLQDTWKKLDIGQNGYLNVEELALVCEHIGMDMTEEVIAQLFENLDCDQDGQISFDEFLQGLFQHGEPQNCNSPLIKPQAPKHYNESREELEISSSSVSGIFSCIDASNTGYADATSILELWESLELPCSQRVLEELGFNINSKINLGDLTSVLEDIIGHVLTTPLLQLAFLTYQNEQQYLRQSIEQMNGERKKLKVSVDEANARAALLAQEVDDNHAKLENSLQNKLQAIEKKYQDQARELVEELKQERDGINSQMSKLKQQLCEEISVMKDEESKLKNKFNLLEQDNARLDQELHEVTEKHLEAEKLNELFQKELATVPDLRARLADLESNNGALQELHHQSLLIELDNLKKINHGLQDKIDELTLDMENMQHQNISSDNGLNKNVNRTHSWLSDYKKAATAGYKRHGSESSTDENSDDECAPLGKMRKTFLFQEDKSMQSLELPDEKFKKTIGAFKPPNAVDIFLADLCMDNANLVRKLKIAEEKQILAEKASRKYENKCNVMQQMIVNLSKPFMD